MEDRLRSQLEQEFAPEVERLSELLGRDLSLWRRGTGSVPRDVQEVG